MCPQVIILEDDRKINPIRFGGKHSDLYFSPFELTVLYNERQKVAMAELSRYFKH